MTDFEAWPKTPRLYRDIVITEKIDGTNGAVVVQAVRPEDFMELPHPPGIVIDPADGRIYQVAAQSRNRLVTPDNDNAGFARWVYTNAVELARTLGAGYHYGEWWGKGIQRGYGLDEKRFSLFNTSRWSAEGPNGVTESVPGLDVVPELYRGVFDEREIRSAIGDLQEHGSFAAPFPRAEGIIVYHSQSKQVYKVLLENDHLSKTEADSK